MSIGTRIRQRRIELDISQETLAKMMGYKTKSSITKIESGETDVSLSKVKDFARVLKTTVPFLMEWDESPIIDYVKNDEDAEFLVETFSRLTPEAKKQALRMVSYLFALRGEPINYNRLKDFIE